MGDCRMHQMEEINRKTWTNIWSLREYGRSEGYLDVGERLALDTATSSGRPRILDIGVGGGRTAKLLQDKGDYVGIDYTPEMVARARANHPLPQIRTYGCKGPVGIQRWSIRPCDIQLQRHRFRRCGWTDCGDARGLPGSVAGQPVLCSRHSTGTGAALPGSMSAGV